MGLGINKDLEPLVREVRRRGGTVEITGSNHVRWVLGEWRFGTGLTMSSASAQAARRNIEAQLAALDAPELPFAVVGPNGRGKFEVHGPDGPVVNGGGNLRAFADRDTARRLSNELNRAAHAGGLSGVT
jgi:hypothetical protein